MTTLLYSGNLGIGQDLDTVLRAAALLNGDADLHILIVGGGKRLAHIRRLAAALKLANAEFRAPVPLGELPSLLAAGDIHVVCQKPGTEGLLVPSKIYSTLAAGRPSLFVGPADCEVGRIIRDSRSGFIVAPGDIEGAADALRMLAGSVFPRREMGEHARAYYERHFGRQRSVSRIIDIIEQAAGNGR
jgi:colanic acid biosynthesis glycosyl transferase WcaI